MKKLTAVLTACLSAVILQGCVVVSVSPGYGGIAGSGEIISASYPCGDFNELRVGIPAVLYYTAGKSDAVTIKLQENLAEHVRVENRAGTLVVFSDVNISFSGSTKIPEIYVSAPLLEKITAAGIVEMGKSDVITADSFELYALGLTSGELSLDVKELRAVLSGAGEITLTGTAERAELITTGAGSFNAIGLDTKKAHVEVSGVGSVELSCSDTLSAVISGIGDITCKGAPELSEDRSGLGRVVFTD
ncbi:MAG: DUF2807 domain-containing protein [Oscillospiraceae bacterium]|nr:DUF2807 domain-containing protein [Oscillospiraceae bacterium]